MTVDDSDGGKDYVDGSGGDDEYLQEREDKDVDQLEGEDDEYRDKD